MKAPDLIHRSPAAALPQLGMIVLQTDETVENESRFYLRDATVQLLCTRIAVSDAINAGTLQAMRARIRDSLALLPAAHEFDVIAYACTSAAAVIGEEEVARDIHRAVNTKAVTNPLTAAKAALTHLGARHIAYVSPYVPQVAETMQQCFTRAGFTIAAQHSFGIESDRAVAALPPAQILEAVMQLPMQFPDDQIDAVFISCTNLNCAALLPLAEERLGKPVVSSNQALLWHALKLAGASLSPLSQPPPKEFGRLFAE